MVAVSELNSLGLAWLCLASRGLALGFDRDSSEAALLQRSESEELYGRNFDDDLYERDVEAFRRETQSPALAVRGGASINFNERIITGKKKNTPIPPPPKEVDTKAYWDKKYGKTQAKSGPAKYRRSLKTRGGASINFNERIITGKKKNTPIPPPPKEINTKAYWDKKYGKTQAKSGPAKYRRGLKARGGASINFNERIITGKKKNTPIPPPPKEIDTKAYWDKKYGKVQAKSGPAKY